MTESIHSYADISIDEVAFYYTADINIDEVAFYCWYQKKMNMIK